MELVSYKIKSSWFQVEAICLPDKFLAHGTGVEVLFARFYQIGVPSFTPLFGVLDGPRDHISTRGKLIYTKNHRITAFDVGTMYTRIAGEHLL